MGYYCTVPQCTSLAGKTKNVKFHRFPRDVTMADKWNVILKRGKPYTKYSKVCSLHFTQADYNVTTMGAWKTLSKDAVPSQNLPKLNPDGTVMVIRKSRTVKYRESRHSTGEKSDRWSLPPSHTPMPAASTSEPLLEHHDPNIAYRLQALSAIASQLPPQNPTQPIMKPKKQDAFMQTDPIDEDEDMTQPNNSYSETSENSFNSEQLDYSLGQKNHPMYKEKEYNKSPTKKFENNPKDYSKDEYMPQTNEEYNKEAEKYALERKSLNGYDKSLVDYPKHDYQKPDYHKQDYEKPEYEKSDYQKQGYQKPDYDKTDYPKNDYAKQDYQKNDYLKQDYQKTDYPKQDYHKTDYPKQDYQKTDYPKQDYPKNDYTKPDYQKHDYQKPIDAYQMVPDYLGYTYPDSVDVLRNQQHNLEMLQQQHRLNENQNFFNENHIKQEIDLNSEEEKYMYERAKDQLDASAMYGARGVSQQRLLELHLQHQVKQEPDTSGCDNVMQPQGSPYYGPNGHTGPGVYGEQRPGAELLIAKQNALAAHTQLSALLEASARPELSQLSLTRPERERERRGSVNRTDATHDILWRRTHLYDHNAGQLGQNTMKRPFFYSETPHYSPLHRYEDLTRILQ